MSKIKQNSQYLAWHFDPIQHRMDAKVYNNLSNNKKAQIKRNFIHWKWSRLYEIRKLLNLILDLSWDVW